MAEKTVTFINNSQNPHRMKNAEGVIVSVQIGETIEVSAEDALKHAKIRGFVDTAKYVKPSSEVEGLKKKIAELEAKVASLIEELKKKK